MGRFLRGLRPAKAGVELDGPYRAPPSEAIWCCAEEPFVGWWPDEGRDQLCVPSISPVEDGLSRLPVQSAQWPEEFADEGVSFTEQWPEGPPDVIFDPWATGPEG